jgi:uncharacterized protein
MDFLTLEGMLPPQLKSRWESLLDRFRRMDSAVVALSGGVDSGLLCAAAYRALGERMLAVTVRSPVEALDDVDSARTLADQVGFPLRILDYDDLSNPEFVSNPPDRCYICKLVRFRHLGQLAAEEGFATLVEGTNSDDLDDYRPGRRAVAETGAVLLVWDRPSAPCLATRFPYGSPVTHEGLHQVANGERYLHELGFRVVRVRHHGTMARLEVATDEINRLIAMREEVAAYFKTMGFTYVSADLSGYRLGSLNEVLK